MNSRNYLLQPSPSTCCCTYLRRLDYSLSERVEVFEGMFSFNIVDCSGLSEAYVTKEHSPALRYRRELKLSALMEGRFLSEGSRT